MNNHERILNHIRENYDSHLEFLKRLVKQPSISVENHGTAECAEMISKEMDRIGFKEPSLFSRDKNPIVFGQYESNNPEVNKTLLLYGAYDSNPIEEDSWDHDPFDPTLTELPELGTSMIGRGVNNKMKVAGILNAVDSIKNVLGDVPVNLLVVLDGEEEMFSPNLSEFIDEERELLEPADALYMPFSSQNSKGTARVQLGYKGILYLELEASGERWGRGPSQNEIHSMHRPIVDNPAWHLLEVLNSMTGTDGNDVTIDGFNDDIAEPDDEFVRLMHRLAVEFDIESYKKGLGVKNLKGTPKDPRDVLEDLFFTAQLNIDGIWSGYTGPGAEAVIPLRARAKIEIRLIPNQNTKRTLKQIMTHLDNHGYSDILVEVLAAVESCRTSINENIATSLIRAYEKIGIEYQIWPSSIATIPIYLFNQEPLNLPFATGCVGSGGHSHGPNEYAVVKGSGKIGGLAEYEGLIASVIHEYGRMEEP